MDVKPYDISGGETVACGYYAALESIFRRYIGALEVQFYDRFNKVFEFDYEIQTGSKFQPYLQSLPTPVPIFLFQLIPLSGESLLIMGNGWCNLFLNTRNAAMRNTILQDDSFGVTVHNSQFMGKLASQTIRRFCFCWKDIQHVEGKLRRLVSNQIKAKVMDPLETCVLVKVKSRYKDFEAWCQFCFSSYQLDTIMREYRHKALIIGEATRREHRADRSAMVDLLMSETPYKVSGELGRMHLSQDALMKSLRRGDVLPFDNRIDNDVTVKINGIPILSAVPGVTDDGLSLKINGRLADVVNRAKERKKHFSKLTFPCL